MFRSFLLLLSLFMLALLVFKWFLKQKGPAFDFTET